MSFIKKFSSILTPPRYLEMPATGLDISDRAIRFVEFSKNADGLEMVSFGEEKLPRIDCVRGKF